MPQYVTEVELVGANITLSGSFAPPGPVGILVFLPAGTHGLVPYLSTGYSQMVAPTHHLESALLVKMSK